MSSSEQPEKKEPWILKVCLKKLENANSQMKLTAEIAYLRLTVKVLVNLNAEFTKQGKNVNAHHGIFQHHHLWQIQLFVIFMETIVFIQR